MNIVNMFIWLSAIVLLLYLLVVANSVRLVIAPKRPGLWTNLKQELGLSYKISCPGWDTPERLVHLYNAKYLGQ